MSFETALAALVLAAGEGSRMGRPKATILWRGRSFARHAVALAEAAGCAPIVVVSGAVRLTAADLGSAEQVWNEGWSQGPTSSLRRGLEALPRGRSVLLLTVDRPHLRPDTALALAAAAREAPTAIWQPVHEGRRGHPILYPADLVPILLALPLATSPRELLARPEISARRRLLPTADPAVLDNIDHPEDLSRLL